MFACVNVNAYFLKKFWYAVLYAGSFERWTSIVSGTMSGHIIVLQVMSMAYTRHSHIISTAQFTKSIMTISTWCPLHGPWHDSHILWWWHTQFVNCSHSWNVHYWPANALQYHTHRKHGKLPAKTCQPECLLSWSKNGGLFWIINQKVRNTNNIKF